jgi:hypothetical protein|mmetsp:Transcript_2899/g.5440  ORF Transcript_2899/g.5440 Transcript_2899/m.5440 type:complete len:212 (+) Transcript_2899:526-1161(+)
MLPKGAALCHVSLSLSPTPPTTSIWAAYDPGASCTWTEHIKCGWTSGDSIHPVTLYPMLWVGWRLIVADALAPSVTCTLKCSRICTPTSPQNGPPFTRFGLTLCPGLLDYSDQANRAVFTLTQHSANMCLLFGQARFSSRNAFRACGFKGSCLQAVTNLVLSVEAFPRCTTPAESLTRNIVFADAAQILLKRPESPLISCPCFLENPPNLY